MSYMKSYITDEDLKIKGLVKEDAAKKHFHNIDYVIEPSITLYPKRFFTFGILEKVEWYADEQLTDKILQVDIVYNHDTLGLATDRTVTRTWYKNDGTPHSDTKITKKNYTINPQDQLDEAVQRRTNNVRQTNLWLIGAVPSLTVADPNISDRTTTQIKDDGVAFFEKYEIQESQYIKVGSTNLEDAVKNEILPPWGDAIDGWFNTDASPLGIVGVADIRDYIIYQLSNGQRNKNGAI